MADEKKKVVKKQSAEQEKYFKRARGTTLGEGLRATWRKVFLENEEAPKKQKKTDTEIAEFMQKEFPHKAHLYDEAWVEKVRRTFNSSGKEKVTFHAFDEDGDETQGVEPSKKRKKKEKEDDPEPEPEHRPKRKKVVVKKKSDPEED